MEERHWKRRRRSGPLITLAVALGLGTAGVVHTVGLEAAGRSGAVAELEPRDPLAGSLRDSVVFQCDQVGRRTARYSPRQEDLEAHLRAAFDAAGLRFVEHDYRRGTTAGRNLVGVLPGRGAGAVLVGAHFDSYGKGPCANATASAVAAVEGVMSLLRGEALERSVLFAFFDNGERPHRGRETAGAHAWLEDLAGGVAGGEWLPEGEDLELVVLVGSFGAWSEVPGSHAPGFPWDLVVPDTADWVGVFSGLGDRSAAVSFLRRWARHTELPARGFALPAWAPGVPVGDQAPFRAAGIPCLLVSDTGFQRSPWLRTPADHHLEIDFDRMAARVRVLAEVVADAAGR